MNFFSYPHKVGKDTFQPEIGLNLEFLYLYSQHVESRSKPFGLDIMDKSGNNIRVPSERETEFPYGKSSLFDYRLLIDGIFCIFTCTFYILYMMYFLHYLIC